MIKPYQIICLAFAAASAFALGRLSAPDGSGRSPSQQPLTSEPDPAPVHTVDLNRERPTPKSARTPLASFATRVSTAKTRLGREQLLLEFVNGLTSKELRDVLANTGAIEDPIVRWRLEELLFERLGRVDPHEAIEFAQKRTGAIKRNALTSLVRGWTVVDAEAAWQWTTSYPSYPDGAVQKALVNTAIESLHEDGQSEIATSLLAEADFLTIRVPALATHVASWARRDPSAAGQWVADLPDSGERVVALPAYIREAAGANPEAVLDWIPSLERTGAQSSAYIAFVEALSENGEFLKAAEWLADVPSDPVYDGALGQVATRLVGQNSEAALKIIKSQYDTGRQQKYLKIGARMQMTERPEDALTWAMHFSDPAERDRFITRTVEYWQRRDPAVANDLLTLHPAIGPSLKQSLLSDQKQR